MKSQIWKIILALLPLILLVGVSLYLSGLFGNSIPDFTGERLDGRTFTKKNLRADVPVVIFYIDINCDDCNKLVKGVIENTDKFKNTHVLFLSPQGKPGLKAFNAKFELGQFNFITLLQDRFMNFDIIVKAKAFPTVLIYNKNHRLLKRYDQPPKIEEIIAVLES